MKNKPIFHSHLYLQVAECPPPPLTLPTPFGESRCEFREKIFLDVK